MPDPVEKSTVFSRIDFYLLLVIVLAGTAVSIAGISWGMPYNQDGDEWTLMNSVLMMPFRKGDPRLYFYGVPYIYIYSLAVGVVFLIQYITGIISSVQDFAIAFLRDPTTIVVTGRAISGAAGTASAVFLYLIGRRFLDRLSSMLIALAFLVSMVAIATFHTIRLEGMLTLLVFLIVYLMIDAGESIRRLIAVMLLIGVAVSCKLPAVALTVPLAVLLIHRFGVSRGGALNAARSPVFWCSPLIVAAGFIVVNPWFLINFPTAIKQLTAFDDYTDYAFTHISLREVLIFYWDSLNLNLGVVGAVAVTASPLLIFMRRRIDAVILLVSGLAYLAILLSVSDYAHYWLLPVFPLLLIGGMAFWNELLARFISKKNAGRVVTLLCVIVLFMSAQSGWKSMRSFFLPNTKDISREWVEKNIPAGTAIAMDTGRYLPTNTLALRQSPARLKEMLEEDKKQAVESYLGGGADHFFRYMAMANKGLKTYEIYPILHGNIWKGARAEVRDSVQSLEFYRSKGVKYIIISDAYFLRYFRAGDRFDECSDFVRKYYKFYIDVISGLPNVATFEPEVDRIIGPKILVYELPAG